MKTRFQTIVYGVAHLEEVFSSMGCKKVMLVAGSTFKRSELGQNILAKLTIPSVVFDHYRSNPVYEDVCAGVELFNQERCDGLIAVGGGSCIDVAKCIKLFCHMDPSVNYLEQEASENDIPFVAIPTTAGTGSESTRFAVIYFNGKKQSINHLNIIPNTAVLEPSVLASLPVYQRKCTVMDAYCQAIESWWSIHSTEESIQLARQAVEILTGRLVTYAQHGSDKALLKAVMEGANLAGQAINLTQTTAPHAFSYKLTSLYHLPHGHAVALCLPKIWRYMLSHINQCIDPRGQQYLKQVFEDIAKGMGCSNANEAILRFEELLKVMDLQHPTSAQRSEDLALLASSVNPVRLKNNPVLLGEEGIREVYEEVVYKS